MQKFSPDGSFSLVLSGGGALGIAHLGVLHDMESRGMVPAEVVGTSMGGIIAACLAIGMSEREIYGKIEAFGAVTKWMKLSLSGNAIVEHSKIAKILAGIFGDREMSDTTLALKLIATDLRTGHKRVFGVTDRVLIRDAVLATMAIPGIFSEKEIEGRVYGDGFLCENLGITQAAYRDILAVDVLGRGSFGSQMPDNLLKSANVLEMFERSMRILIYNQTQTNLRHSDANILLIEPDTSAFKTFHFHRAAEIRAKGLGLL